MDTSNPPAGSDDKAWFLANPRRDYRHRAPIVGEFVARDVEGALVRRLGPDWFAVMPITLEPGAAPDMDDILSALWVAFYDKRDKSPYRDDMIALDLQLADAPAKGTA